MLQNFRSTQVNNRSIQIIYRYIQIIYRSIKSEYESNSAPRSDNLKLLKARFINLAQKIFGILHLNRGASSKTLHASTMEVLMISLGFNQARPFRKC